MDEDQALEAIDAGEFVVTDEGLLRAEDVAARRGAGIDVEEVSEEEIAAQALREQEADVFDAPITTALERGLGAATFGLTDVLRGSESAYEAGRRVQREDFAVVGGARHSRRVEDGGAYPGGADVEGRDQRGRRAHAQTTSTPGFMMPAGSRARFTAVRMG